MLQPWAMLFGLELGSLAPKESLLVFICHTWCGTVHSTGCRYHCLTTAATLRPLHPSYPSRWIVFKYSVVGLPYSLIFCQFWLFFVLRLVVILLMVVWGSELCLPSLSSWLTILLILKEAQSQVGEENLYMNKYVNCHRKICTNYEII